MARSEKPLNSAVNAFASELYQAVRSDGGNSIVCPFTLQILLGMVLEGADGKTANEIAKVIHHSKDDKEVLKGYKNMISSLECPSILIVTRLFVEKTIEIKRDFKSLTSKYFSCDFDGRDFIKKPEDSRLAINKWVEEITNQKIIDVLPPGSVDADAKLVMVNAIYFYSQWKIPFERENTIVMPFYVTPERTVDVNMMVARKPFNYMESAKLDAKIVQLLYVDETFSIIIILPNKVDGLSQIESKLKSIDFYKELSTPDDRTVNLMLPRFRIERTMDLNDSLRQKMPAAFSEKANFSGITDGHLYITKIVQKAFIEVNEEGTEAAASTGIVASARSLRIVQDMKCDHPFFFQIVKDGMILFQGALVDPVEEKKPTIDFHKEKIPEALGSCEN